MQVADPFLEYREPKLGKVHLLSWKEVQLLWLQIEPFQGREVSHLSELLVDS